MILYFSGTGNSSYVAKKIQSISGDEIISMNKLIKEEREKILKSEKPFVFVCPTYAWRIPKVVENFIRETQFSGTNEVYFILTCGSEAGDAVKYLKKLCKEKDFKLMGFNSVDMPENYIARYSAPEKEEVNSIIQRATNKIVDISEHIKNGEKFMQEEISLGDKFKSAVVNPIFYSVIVSAKGFYYTDACISCGKCSTLCPLNNIKLVNGQPQWGDRCTHCMACICGCPKEAIEYKNKTKGKTRYYNFN